MGLSRPCLEPGCPNVITSGSRCASCHQKARARDAERRGTAAQRGYDSAWVAVRNSYAHEHPLCEDCIEKGIVNAMDLVDHVIPLPHGPRLDKANLRSLCRGHHAAKTERDKAAGYTANSAPQAAQPEQRKWLVA